MMLGVIKMVYIFIDFPDFSKRFASTTAKIAMQYGLCTTRDKEVEKDQVWCIQERMQ